MSLLTCKGKIIWLNLKYFKKSRLHTNCKELLSLAMESCIKQLLFNVLVFQF